VFMNGKLWFPRRFTLGLRRALRPRAVAIRAVAIRRRRRRRRRLFLERFCSLFTEPLIFRHGAIACPVPRLPALVARFIRHDARSESARDLRPARCAARYAGFGCHFVLKTRGAREN